MTRLTGNEPSLSVSENLSHIHFHYRDILDFQKEMRAIFKNYGQYSPGGPYRLADAKAQSNFFIQLVESAYHKLIPNPLKKTT